MAATEAKRAKVPPPDSAHDQTQQLVALLTGLGELLASAGKAAGDGRGAGLPLALERLQAGLNDSEKAQAAFKAVADAEQTLQAAVVALQAAVDSFTPPAGYKPPPPADEAFVRGLLSYAHRLSYSASAPLGYQPGQPLYFFKPPAPQEAEMRASQLHAFSRDWDARQAAAAAQQQAAVVVQGPAPSAPAQAAEPAASDGAPGGGDIAAMAAQHGLDVGQLLASMPPGWKPGDPIALAPAGTPPPTARAGEAEAPAPVAAQQPRREASPAEEERGAAPPPPPLTGIFLDDFEYDYVSSDGGDSSGDSDDDASD